MSSQELLQLLSTQTCLDVLVLILAEEEEELHPRIFSHLDCPGFTEEKTKLVNNSQPDSSYRTTALALEFPGAEKTAMRRLVVMLPSH